MEQQGGAPVNAPNLGANTGAGGAGGGDYLDKVDTIF